MMEESGNKEYNNNNDNESNDSIINMNEVK